MSDITQLPAHIFICHSSQDKEQAKDLVGRLTNDGFSCWIDDSAISAASQWSREIVEAIENCSLFIILLSAHALSSHNVIKELALASESKKPVIPIDLENISLSKDVKYQLAGLQRVNFKDYSRIEEAVHRLLNAPDLPAIVPNAGRRHLLAMMFSDIKGYSLMMNTDEELAMKLLRYHNSFMRQMIESHEGRVVEIIGDAFLAVFESAVRAVETGVAIQEGFKEYNQTCPEKERFQVRIGIHLGDVIEEQGGVKGDAVNIAARIQAIAPAGGVAFSENIYNAVAHKTPLEVISLGAKKLKNISDTYTIYSLKGFGEIQTASTGSGESDLLRLAVLPFEDLSPNHDNDWFAEGMMDELTGTLGSLSQLIVPGRSSVMVYKKDRPKASIIGEELEVRYIVEGTVRKINEKIRIFASLTDTKTNTQIWSNKFDGTFNEIFDFQEQVAREITVGLKLKLTTQDKKRIEQKKTENPEAFELYQKANYYIVRQTKQDSLDALDCLQEAVELDPSFASAFAFISLIHTNLYVRYDHADSHIVSAATAVEKARLLNPDLPEMYRALSDVYLQRGENERAIEMAKKMIELDPKNPISYGQLGFLYAQLWQPEESAKYFEEGLQLNPAYLIAHFNLCLQYERLNEIGKRDSAAERALPYFERHIKRNPDDQGQKINFAILLEYLGRRKESLQITSELISSPNADGTTIYNGACIIARQGDYRKAIDSLAKAIEKGFHYIDTFQSDPDLDSLRKMSEFQELVKKLEKIVAKEDKVPDLFRLAVLPFEDLSPNHDNEWFADGMMDELIGTLGSLSKLIVPGRTSVMEYKKNRPKQKVIAEELEVRYLVEGTVRKADKKIRISASLTDAKTNTQLWNNQFDGNFDDIFDFQERVAREITEGLKLKLTLQDEKKIEEKLTDNPGAYELYEKAQLYLWRNTKQDLLYTLDCLNEAVKLDPSFASAYAYMSMGYCGLYRTYEQHESHLSAAEEALEKARQLNPELPVIYVMLSFVHLLRGEKEEAIRAAKKNVELAPKDSLSHFLLSHIYAESGQLEKAVKICEVGLRLDPTMLRPYSDLCDAYDRLKDIIRRNQVAERALPYFERYLKKNPDDQFNKMNYANIIEYLGRKGESLRIVDELISAPNADGQTIYSGACNIARRGDHEKALAALSKAVDKGYTDLNTIRTDPNLDGLRSIPEFIELVKKLEEKKSEAV